jgi:hypothetical protein
MARPSPLNTHQLASLQKLLKGEWAARIKILQRFCEYYLIHRKGLPAGPRTHALVLKCNGKEDVYFFVEDFDSLCQCILASQRSSEAIIKAGILSQQSPLWQCIEQNKAFKVDDSFTFRNKKFTIVCVSKKITTVHDYASDKEQKQKQKHKQKTLRGGKGGRNRQSALTQEERSERAAYFNEILVPFGGLNK